MKQISCVSIVRIHAISWLGLLCVSIGWRLIKRAFEIDIARCPQCGRNMKIIAAILERASIIKILENLGLPDRGQPRSPGNVHGLSDPS
ncbi:MAG: hypothetical protein IPP22_11525 [Nitrosomonas sp.]|nr:hypothetical protein [Nitrosomonas sp.]